MVQEVDPQDGETHSSKKKGPLAMEAANGDCEGLFSPAGDVAAVRP
jgi:hypothetical protein